MGNPFSTPDPPPAMNVGAVRGQANDQNTNNAYQNAAFNRLNQTDQFGNTLNYTQNGTDANGNPIFGVNQQLGGMGQMFAGGLGAMGQRYMQMAGGGNPLMPTQGGAVGGPPMGTQGGAVGGPPMGTQGGAVGGPPMGTQGGIPNGAGYNAGTDGGAGGGGNIPNAGNAFDQAYGYATANLEPRFEQTRAAMENRLRNQGLDPTSEAYKSQMNDVGLQQNEARNNLVTGIQGQLFNQGMQSRQQMMGELMPGMQFGAGTMNPNHVNAPQVGVQNVDVAGLHNNAWNQQFQNYQQQMASRNAMLGGLGGLGGAALGAALPGGGSVGGALLGGLFGR